MITGNLTLSITTSFSNSSSEKEFGKANFGATPVSTVAKIIKAGVGMIGWDSSMRAHVPGAVDSLFTLLG